MPLSCSCEYDAFDWWYWHPKDYIEMPKFKRRRRCNSCGKFIDAGDTAIQFECFREARNDIEERIWGDEVILSCKYFCEHCSDIYFSLHELKFECVGLGDNMDDMLKEYRENYL